MIYIYPQDLKAKPNMWMWGLKDFAVLGIGALISAIFLIYVHWSLPLGITAVYAFMTIRLDETTILDYVWYAISYFIASQQYYEWR